MAIMRHPAIIAVALLLPSIAFAHWEVDRSKTGGVQPVIIASTATEVRQPARLSVNCIAATGATTVSVSATDVSGDAIDVEYRFGEGVWHRDRWQVEPGGKFVSVDDAKAKALALIMAHVDVLTVRLRPADDFPLEHVFRVADIEAPLREIRALCKW
jgi:hypothetical protein